MCGIVGLIGAYQNGLTGDEKEMFTNMLFLDTQRGWDSTGVFMVENVGNMRLKKAAVHGPDFIRTPEYKSWMDTAYTSGMFLVGHNRAATRGTVSDENAHPFCVDDKIVLVQNGTYTGSHKHLADTEVDTEAVAHVLAQHEDVEEALQRINAAYCLAWYDLRTKTLNLIRNNQRPMYLGENSEGGWMFASEIETLFYSAARAKIKFKGVPKLIEPGELHTWELQSGKKWYYSSRKIDNNYRYKSGDSTAPGADDDYAAWAQYYNQRGGSRRHDFHSVTPIQNVVRDLNSPSNEISIFTYVQHNKFSEFAAEQDTCHEYRENYAKNRPGTMVVEFIDYLPVIKNQTGDKSKWFVYGKIVTPDERDYSPMVYLQVTGDETVAFDFTLKTLYTVDVPGSPVMHVVTPPGVDKYHVLTLFSCNPKPIKLLEKNDNATTH